MAVDALSGKTLWQMDNSETAEILPLTLAVDGQRVFFQNTNADANAGDDDFNLLDFLDRSYTANRIDDDVLEDVDDT